MPARAASLLIALFVWAPASWGLSASTFEYLARAQSLNLANQEKWLRLGHYEKTLFGNKSAFAGPFFISAEGARNPSAELERSIVAFLEPSAEDLARYKMPPQCFFRARFNWLKRELGFPQSLVQACPERDEWKRRLNARAVTVIFAASDMGTATSSFGHIFLKLINPENAGKELIDYGLNYAAAANKNDGILYAVKGLFGYYRGSFSLLPYHQKIREYTNVEGRDIWEFPLNLNDEQVSELVDHLLELEGSSAPYYFLSNNCSYEVLRLIEAVLPELDAAKHLPWYVLPIDTLKHISEHPMLLGEGKFRESLKTDYIKDLRRLNPAERKALANVTATELESTTQLTPAERAHVLEAAMKFVSLRAFETEQDMDDLKYKLSVQRARLGMVAPPLKESPPESPLDGHDSSEITLGFGEYEQRSFTSLKFRHAFHELEQGDSAAVKFSHAEILSFEARKLKDPDQWSLSRATLINLLNSSPVTELDKSISWKARVEWTDPWRPELEGGLGFSADGKVPFRARAMAFVTALYQDDRAHLGPNLILAFRFLIDWVFRWTPEFTTAKSHTRKRS